MRRQWGVEEEENEEEVEEALEPEENEDKDGEDESEDEGWRPSRQSYAAQFAEMHRRKK